MNTCPVFRRSGGYSYGYTVPGPIGSLLAPQRDPQKYGGLPFASSLCGSCSDVCPVKIDLHHELYAFRQELVRKKIVPLANAWGMAVLSFVLARPWLYRLAGRLLRWLVPRLPRAVVYGPWNPWGVHRELPPMPRRSFRELIELEPPPTAPMRVHSPAQLNAGAGTKDARVSSRRIGQPREQPKDDQPGSHPSPPLRRSAASSDALPVSPLPAPPEPRTYSDPEAQFAESFTSVGGRLHPRLQPRRHPSRTQRPRALRPGAQDRLARPWRRSVQRRHRGHAAPA